MTQEAQIPAQEGKKLEFKLDRLVASMPSAVEDMSKMRSSLGILSVKDGVAAVTDAYALVVATNTGTETQGRAVAIPLAVLSTHAKQDVQVATDGAKITVAHLDSKHLVMHSTEGNLPTAPHEHEQFLKLLEEHRQPKYAAHIALGAGRIKALLSFFSYLEKNHVDTTRLYIPEDPIHPVLLVAETLSGVKFEALLMPQYVKWNKEQA